MSTQDLNLQNVSQLTQWPLPEKAFEKRENQPENAVIQRTENGLFLPGNPGGPGRPPNVVSPTAAYKAILAEKGATELAQTVYNDAITAKNARDRLAAASEITDRVDGKAIQRQDVRGVFVMMPAEGSLADLDKWADEE